MKRYFLISLLLLFIEPLFMLNVHAQELDSNYVLESQNLEVFENNNELQKTNLNDNEIVNNDNDQIEVQNEFDINQVIQDIPSEYDVDFTEEDIFQIQDGMSIIESDLFEKIMGYFQSISLDLSEYGYSFYVKSLLLNQLGEINQFVITFVENNTNQIVRKEVTVHYNNENDYNDENQEVVDQLIENDAIIIDSYNDFYSNSAIGEVQTVEEYLDCLVEDSNIAWYYQETEVIEKELSIEKYGYAYFFMNQVLYRCVSTEFFHSLLLSVSPNITDSDIVSEVRDMIVDNYQVESSSLDIEVKNDFVFSSKQDESMGFVTINRLNKSQVSHYSIISGSDAILEVDENTQLIIKVNADSKKFIKLLINGVVVNPKYYELSDNLTITLKKDFINALDKAQYHFVARFSDGDVMSCFTLKEKTRVVDPESYVPYQPVYYNNYNYYNDYYSSNTQEVQSLKMEEKEASIPNEVVKKKEEDSDSKVLEVIEENKDLESNEENKKESKKSNMNYTPIIIVAFAFIFGAFGGFLYKKSLED